MAQVLAVSHYKRTLTINNHSKPSLTATDDNIRQQRVLCSALSTSSAMVIGESVSRPNLPQSGSMLTCSAICSLRTVCSRDVSVRCRSGVTGYSNTVKPSVSVDEAQGIRGQYFKGTIYLFSVCLVHELNASLSVTHRQK